MRAIDAARGKWPAVLSACGVPADALDGRHHPCPKDGQGKDRFRFANQNGTGSYFCACSEGDKGGIALVMCCRGLSYHEAALEVEKVADLAEETMQREKKDPAIALNYVRQQIKPVNGAVSGYLKARGLESPPGIKQARLWYFRDGKKTQQYETMVGRVTSWHGKAVNYHLTYLDEGKKAHVETSRKLMTPMSPMAGSAIRLYPATEEMGIAEGIETAIAARMLFDVPTWSCISAGLLEAFQPPDGVKKVWIFGDNDVSYTGQAAAYGCAKRMASQGIEAVVLIPSRYGDWNDVLNEKK